MTNRSRREFLKRVAAGAGASVLLPGFPRGASSTGWDQVPEILKRIVAPVFPARDFDIPHFGAAGGRGEGLHHRVCRGGCRSKVTVV